MASGRSCAEPGQSGGVSGFLRAGVSCLGALRLARSFSVAGGCACSGTLSSGCLDVEAGDLRDFFGCALPV